ncbi:MAG: hypothetical protein OYH77_01830 [Pseudomonadota bacterium]|nr:hypothetical protein [Pseudomonadota bacterium]
MTANSSKFKKFISSKSSKFWISIIFTILLAYVLATIVSAIGANLFLKTKKTSRRDSRAVNTVSLNKKLNYRDMRRVVLKRNIFNSTGEVPDTEEESNSLASNSKQCNPPTLKIKVVGMIYLGNENSVVTVREANYSQADVYQVNDMLIGRDNAQVVAIERERMVIDNAGSRECYEIEQPKIAAASSGYAPPKTPEKKKPTTKSNGNTVVLNSTWVEKELGPGFSKIIQSARLVPNTVDGDRVNGFKIFAIKSGTLFNKIGLRNGDIIQRVNDVSLEQVEQGFALYQTFQEDQEIVFNIVRKDNPQTISVMIK